MQYKKAGFNHESSLLSTLNTYGYVDDITVMLSSSLSFSLSFSSFNFQIIALRRLRQQRLASLY